MSFLNLTPKLSFELKFVCSSLTVTAQQVNACSTWDCVKRVRIRSFSCPYFPAFGLNTERYGESHHIQSGYRKIETRKVPNMDTFHPVWTSCFGVAEA